MTVYRRELLCPAADVGSEKGLRRAVTGRTVKKRLVMWACCALHGFFASS